MKYQGGELHTPLPHRKRERPRSSPVSSICPTGIRGGRRVFLFICVLRLPRDPKWTALFCRSVSLITPKTQQVGKWMFTYARSGTTPFALTGVVSCLHFSTSELSSSSYLYSTLFWRLGENRNATYLLEVFSLTSLPMEAGHGHSSEPLSYMSPFYNEHSLTADR